MICQCSRKNGNKDHPPQWRTLQMQGLGTDLSVLRGHLPVLTIPGKRLMLSLFVIADIVNRVENFLTFLTTLYHLIGHRITAMWGTQ